MQFVFYKYTYRYLSKDNHIISVINEGHLFSSCKNGKSRTPIDTFRPQLDLINYEMESSILAKRHVLQTDYRT